MFNPDRQAAAPTAPERPGADRMTKGTGDSAERFPEYPEMVYMLIIDLPGHIRVLSTGVHGQPRISTGNVTEQIGPPGDSSERPISVNYRRSRGPECLRALAGLVGLDNRRRAVKAEPGKRDWCVLHCLDKRSGGLQPTTEMRIS